MGLPLRIVHVNEVANVAAGLAEGLRRAEYLASRISTPVPAARGKLWAKMLAAPVRFWYALSAAGRVRSSADIAHIHFAPNGWVGVLARRPYVLHCHGSDVRIGLRSALRRAWLAIPLRRVAKVLVSTPDLLALVRKARSDVVYLPNPVRTDVLVPGYRPSDGRIRALLFSIMDDTLKGTSRAIEGLHAVAERFPHIEVWCMSWGPDYAQYASLPWVRFVQRVPYERMPGFLQSSDMVVGQLEIGSVGMSELEAMACAKPVVCHFRYQGSYAEEPPILRARWASEVCDAVQALVADPLLRSRLGSAARTWDESLQKRYVATAFRAELVAAVLVFAILLAVEPLVERLYLRGEASSLFRLMALYLPFFTLTMLFGKLCRIPKKPFLYNALTLSTVALYAGAVVPFVRVLHVDVSVVYYAKLASCCGVFAVFTFVFRRYIFGAGSRECLRRLVSYGLPPLPFMFGDWLLSASNRYFLNASGGRDTVGLYSVALKLANVVGLAIASFNLAWGPYAMSERNGPDAPVIYAKVLRLYLALATGLLLAVQLVSPLLVLLFSTPDYMVGCGAAAPPGSHACTPVTAAEELQG